MPNLYASSLESSQTVTCNVNPKFNLYTLCISMTYLHVKLILNNKVCIVTFNYEEA